MGLFRCFNGGRAPRDVDPNSYERDPDEFRFVPGRGRQTETPGGEAKRAALLSHLKRFG
jgi:hypothetical protein